MACSDETWEGGASAGRTQSTTTPFELNCRNPESLFTSTHLFLFFPTCRTTFHTLFNLILSSRSSRQLFTIISSHPPSKIMIFDPPVKQPFTPPNFLLKYSYYPTFAFSLTPRHYLHPSFIHLHLLSPSALVSMFSPLSCCFLVLFCLLCDVLILFCAIALSKAESMF